MGLFDRFRRLLKSNINDMISRAENPDRMLNQLITDMNQQLIDSKKSVAAAIADEKKIERQMNESQSQAGEWERKAMLALKSGKEDLAREALVRKQESEKYAQELSAQWEAQHASVEKLKTALRGLQQKIEEAQRKKNLLVARAKRAEAQKKIQETLGGMSDTSAFQAFDRMSQEMDKLEAENEAYQELEESATKDDLERQFAELEGSATDPEKLLQEMKKKMALEDNSEKDSDKGSNNVDASLEELKKKMRDEESE